MCPPSYFEDIGAPWSVKPACQHPEHNPPNMIVIPQGKKLVHECPACGEVQVVYAADRGTLLCNK